MASVHDARGSFGGTTGKATKFTLGISKKVVAGNDSFDFVSSDRYTERGMKEKSIWSEAFSLSDDLELETS